MKKIALLIAPTAILLIASACSAPDVATTPPNQPAFVLQCRADIAHMTGTSKVSPKADAYCVCVNVEALDISGGYARSINTSERHTIMSMCRERAEMNAPLNLAN